MDLFCANLQIEVGAKRMRSFLLFFTVFLSITANASIIQLDLTQDYVGYKNQPNSGSINVSGNGSALSMLGNNWALFEGPFDISADTVFEFSFSSSIIGELQGFGFDSDKTFHSTDDYRLGTNRFFQLAGSQMFGIQDYNNYATPGDAKVYTVEVGKYVTGMFKYIVFMNDQDAKGEVSQSSFFINNVGQAGVVTVSESGTFYLVLFALCLLLVKRKV